MRTEPHGSDLEAGGKGSGSSSPENWRNNPTWRCFLSSYWLNHPLFDISRTTISGSERTIWARSRRVRALAEHRKSALCRCPFFAIVEVMDSSRRQVCRSESVVKGAPTAVELQHSWAFVPSHSRASIIRTTMASWRRGIISNNTCLPSLGRQRGRWQTSCLRWNRQVCNRCAVPTPVHAMDAGARAGASLLSSCDCSGQPAQQTTRHISDKRPSKCRQCPESLVFAEGQWRPS
jgi:hypothetical protein